MDPLNALRAQLESEKDFYAQRAEESLNADTTPAMTKERALYSTALAILPMLAGLAIKGRRGGLAGAKAGLVGTQLMSRDAEAAKQRAEKLNDINYKSALSSWRDADKRIKDANFFQAKYAPGGPMQQIAAIQQGMRAPPTLTGIIEGSNEKIPSAFGSLGPREVSLRPGEEPSDADLDFFSREQFNTPYADLPRDAQLALKADVVQAVNEAGDEVAASSLPPKDLGQGSAGMEIPPENATGAAKLPPSPQALKEASLTLRMPDFDIEKMAKTASPDQLKDVVDLASSIKKFNQGDDKPLTDSQMTLISNGLKLEAEFKKLMVLADKLGPDTKLPGIFANYKGLETAAAGGAIGNIPYLNTNPLYKAGSPEAAFMARVQRLATLMAATEQGKRLSDLDQRVYERFTRYNRAENMGREDWKNVMEELYQDASSNRKIMTTLLSQGKRGEVESLLNLGDKNMAIPIPGDYSHVPPGYVAADMPDGTTKYLTKEEAQLLMTEAMNGTR